MLLKAESEGIMVGMNMTEVEKVILGPEAQRKSKDFWNRLIRLGQKLRFKAIPFDLFLFDLIYVIFANSFHLNSDI